MNSANNFERGIGYFATLSRPEKNWVTTRLISTLGLDDLAALDDFMASMTAAREALRGGVTVFLSHSSTDKPFVRPLNNYLKLHGIATWLDEADLLAGQSLANRLSSSIANSTLVLAVLSKKSVVSDWVKKELAQATHEEIDGRKIKVVPIVKDDCDMPPELKSKLWLDFRTKHSRRKNQPVLVDAIFKLARENQRALHSGQPTPSLDPWM